MERVVGFLGIIAFLGIAYCFSSDRRRIDWRLVGWGTAMQLIFALLVLGIPALGIPGPLAKLFQISNDAVVALLNYSTEGSRFVFGDLTRIDKNGFIFAVQVLPTIIFFSSLTAVAFHLGFMGYVVRFFAKLMRKFMKASGAETLCAAANIFLGQTESPLLVRPYLGTMTRSELLVVMASGMASVAGGVLAAYVAFLQHRLPDIAGHLITASVMSGPSSLIFAKIIVPETETPVESSDEEIAAMANDANVIEAAARGASEGLMLAVNVAGMLIAFIAVVAFGNGVVGWIGDHIGFASWGQSLVPELLRTAGAPTRLSMELILGWISAPIAWLMGVSWGDCQVIGSLLGQKIILNEFIAYMKLTEVMNSLSDRSLVIASYALCGFANLSSIGIQIGGIGSLIPHRKSDLARLGLRSVLAGSLSTFMAAALIGILI